MNLVGICTSLFVPWVLFSILYAVISFEIHYKNASLCYLLEALGFVGVLACGFLAFTAIQARWNGDAEREPSWFIFLFLTSLIAWILAIVAGDWNFWSNMQPYYDINNLNSYPSVDPSKMRGQQLMDAGRIIFAQGSKLDITKSMGFKNLDAYCVAPITKGETLTRKNVRCIRPGLGLPPREYEPILGCIAARDIELGEPMNWDMIKNYKWN
jgi:hypothetical protein